MKRTAFFISDSTGITAETFGHSLISQFPQIKFAHVTIPYINSAERAWEAVARINQACQEDQARALVFATLAKPEIRHILAGSNGLLLDFFDYLIPPLEEELQSKYASKVGEFHKISDLNKYDTRISALDFALNTDDGLGEKHYQQANVILLGVSRSGKTPTCLYLALKFGILAANYPITAEDLTTTTLPKLINPFKDKLFGLVISPERLHEIRQIRQPNSNYASLQQCIEELRNVESLYKNVQIPYLNSTNFSIEEIATKIMHIKKIKRQI